MAKILERHDDVGVLGHVLYVDGNMRLYADEALTEPVMTEELVHMFYRGVFINYDGYLCPVVCMGVGMNEFQRGYCVVENGNEFHAHDAANRGPV